MTGMPFWDAYKPHLYNANRRARQRQQRTENPVSQRYAIRARWGMEWYELLALLHAQGLNRQQCAQAMGYSCWGSVKAMLTRHPGNDPFTPRVLKPKRHVPRPRFPRRHAVEQNFGKDFWSVVRDFAEKDYTRFDTARAIGCEESTFLRILADNPKQDPFESHNVVGNYTRLTGESFEAALRRMAAAGYSRRQASIEIGYYPSGLSLQRAMDIRGIDVTFKKAEKPKKPKKPREPSISGRYGPKSPIHPWRIS